MTMSLYSKEWSKIFSAALKVFPEAERLVERNKKVLVEDMKGNVLAVVGKNYEFFLPSKEEAA